MNFSTSSMNIPTVSMNDFNIIKTASCLRLIELIVNMIFYMIKKIFSIFDLIFTIISLRIFIINMIFYIFTLK
jgi:hypothetical protein